MEFYDTVMEKSWNFVAKISWQPCLQSILVLIHYLYPGKCQYFWNNHGKIMEFDSEIRLETLDTVLDRTQKMPRIVSLLTSIHIPSYHSLPKQKSSANLPLTSNRNYADYIGS